MTNHTLRFSVGIFALIASCEFLHAEPSRYALVIGIREYPASDILPDLTYTETDAHKVSETLTSGGYSVTLMTQKAAEGVGRKRFSPTAAFIRKQFSDLVANPFLKQEDCLLVVLQGHGIQLPSKNNNRRMTFYFCPSDAFVDSLSFSEDVEERHNLIRIQELYDTLNRSKAGVKLLIADACRNDPTKPDTFRSASATRPPLPKPPGGMAAFFSCSTGQRAVEDPKLKHGVFSYFLIEGLTGRADTDNNREITISELQNYVGRRTFDYVRQTYSRQQTPELTGTVAGFASLFHLPEDQLAGNRAGDLWLNNGLKMRFRWCPAGTFQMGSPLSEPGRQEDENQVRVRLTKGFWLGQYEVTQDEWKQLMGTDINDQRQKTGYTGPSPHGVGNRFPMYYVSWQEAVNFCRQLTARERQAGRIPAGWEYKLPTEAQWEYACRAGTATATSFGNSLSSHQANFVGTQPYNGGRLGPEIGKTVEVGTYKPNAWNFHNMHANVREWCRDYYHERQPGGTDPVGSTYSDKIVNKGGNFRNYGNFCRAAGRGKLGPTYASRSVGFRVALVQTSP